MMRKAGDGGLGVGEDSGCEVVVQVEFHKKNKTREKQANVKARVKDYRMTSRQHPEVPPAQSAPSLCLDNDFPSTVASSLVNEVIAVSTVTLY